LRRLVRHLEHDLRDITTRCHAEREHRITLEVLVGGKTSTFIWLHAWAQISVFNNCSTTLDVSNRYSNLKAAWDSLMEAASHGHPRSFQVAVTVVLE
jgi:hypothetical protein